MRKFSFSLLLAILFCNTGKAYAVDRAVVGYIISDVWYNNIFLIADKVEGDSMAYKNFTVQVKDGGGSELLYNFPNWYNSKFTPKLFHKDISGDGLEDIIVVLISGSGVSLSTKEIHVLNQVRAPYGTYEEVPVESINDSVDRFVKMDRKGNEITISIGKKKYVVDYSKFGYQTPVDSPGYGSMENYEPKDGILYGSTNVSVTIPEAYIGGLEVKYAWDGKMYKAESITFDQAEPYKPSKR